MNTSFKDKLQLILRRAASAFMRYPASMTCAILLAFMGILSVEESTLLSTSLRTSLSLGFMMGLTLNLFVNAIFQRTGMHDKRKLFFEVFWFLVSLGVGLLIDRKDDIPNMTTIRMVIAFAIFGLLFLFAISHKNSRLNYSQTLFMSIKALSIAILYTLVMLAGTNLILLAVKQLLFNELSYKINSEVSILCALIGYAFFLGHLPRLNDQESDETIQKSYHIPKFIEVLFLYILVPIIAIMTLVLFVWCLRIVFTGHWPTFGEVSGIFASYGIIGSLLAILLRNNDAPISKIYRRWFPIAAILFMVFFSIAIVLDIQSNYFSALSYFDIMIVVFTLATVITLMLAKPTRLKLISLYASLLLAISVMPLIGANDLVALTQINRLTHALNKNHMIQSNKVIPNPLVNDRDKEIISRTTDDLLSNNDIELKLPSWFDKNALLNYRFETYGFGTNNGFSDTKSLSMSLSELSLDISGYQKLFGGINQRQMDSSQDLSIIAHGKKDYQIKFGTNKPTVIVYDSDGVKKLINADFSKQIDALFNKYGNDKGAQTKDSFGADEMSFKVEGNGISILIVYQYISLIQNNSDLTKTYDLSINCILWSEKP